MERVCAVALRDGAVLMVHLDYGDRDFWTLPGGGVEPGETPEEAAARELAEEMGVCGAVVRPLLTRVVPERGGMLETYYLMEVSADQTPEPGSNPGYEHQRFLEAAWVPSSACATTCRSLSYWNLCATHPHRRRGTYAAHRIVGRALDLGW
jgi:8-oxo-dGTP diphosphatase